MDLEVKFDSAEQKDKFVRAYFSKLKQQNTNPQKGPVLSEINYGKNSGRQEEDLKELKKQKEHINTEAVQTVEKEYVSNHGLSAPANSEESLHGLSHEQPFKDNIRTQFETPPSKSMAAPEDQTLSLNYKLLEHKL